MCAHGQVLVRLLGSAIHEDRPDELLFDANAVPSLEAIAVSHAHLYERGLSAKAWDTFGECLVDILAMNDVVQVRVFASFVLFSSNYSDSNRNKMGFSNPLFQFY